MAGIIIESARREIGSSSGSTESKPLTTPKKKKRSRFGESSDCRFTQVLRAKPGFATFEFAKSVRFYFPNAPSILPGRGSTACHRAGSHRSLPFAAGPPVPNESRHHVRHIEYRSI